MELQFKKLSEHARLPKYAHDGDSGMDVYATDSKTIRCKRYDEHWNRIHLNSKLESMYKIPNSILFLTERIPLNINSGFDIIKDINKAYNKNHSKFSGLPIKCRVIFYRKTITSEVQKAINLLIFANDVEVLISERVGLALVDHNPFCTLEMICDFTQA